MCEYCDKLKFIAFDESTSDEDKIKIIEEETAKELMCDMLDEFSDIGISYEELGLTQEDFDNAECYAITDEDMRMDFSDSSKQEFKVTPLYKYESRVYGSLGYGKNSRRFCEMVASRTRTGAMRYTDILRLNGSNPGFGSGGSNSYSIFLYRGGSNCKHFWVKYYLDPEKKGLVKAPTTEQPLQIHKGDMPPPNK